MTVMVVMMMMMMVMFRFCHMPKEEHERHPMNQNILINHGVLAVFITRHVGVVIATSC